MTDYEEILERLGRIEALLQQLTEGKTSASAPVPQAEIPPPPCSKCGGATSKRTSARGPFFGCKNYPNCRGIVSWDEAVRLSQAAPAAPAGDQADEFSIPPPPEPDYVNIPF